MASNQKMSRGKKVLELNKDAMFKISCKSDNIFKKHCDGRTEGQTDGRTDGRRDRRTDKVTYRGASLLKISNLVWHYGILTSIFDESLTKLRSPYANSSIQGT